MQARRILVIAITGAWLLGIHVFVVYVLINSGYFSAAMNLLNSENSPGKNELPEHYYRMIDYHLTIDPFVSDGSTIFFGDSITQGLNTDAIVQQSVNYGIGYDTTHGLLERLHYYKSVDRAALIVLAIGVNDMAHRSERDVALNYQQLLRKLPQKVPVLISAVLPVDEKRGWQGFNKRIRSLNANLAKLAHNGRRIFHLDIYDEMSDSEGNLRTEFHKDGVHLTNQGYQLWISRLNRLISEILVTNNKK